MKLNTLQRREFYEQGFIHIPGVVPRIMVNDALRAINTSLGDQGIDPAQITKYRSQSFAPEVQTQKPITNLYNKTPAAELAESLIGANDIKPIKAGQIALRFPGAQDPPRESAPHLDGMYSPHNGVPKSRILSFTMLLGVMLSDVTEPFAGNLTVWPGTHLLYEKYFREHGPEALLEGMPPVNLPPPKQLMGKAGDIVLCHYQLAHGVAANVAPHPRYAIYFRLFHTNHDVQWKEAMKDIWMEWAGMQDIVAAAS